MVGKAFISFRELDAKDSASYISEKLSSNEIDMKPFYSSNNIQPTNDIIKSILESIVDTDLLICLITSGVVCRPWLKWEHEFCKNRNILTLYIVFPDASYNLRKISYLDKNNFKIILDESNNNNALVRKLAETYYQKKNEIKTRVGKKDNITISAKLNKSKFKLSETVEITGKVTHNLVQNSTDSSKVYLHIPNVESHNPPESSTMLNSLSIEKNGNFKDSFVLPCKPCSDTVQTWYVEIKINEKSKLLDIIIDPTSNQGMPKTGTFVEEYPTDTSLSKTSSNFSKSNIDELRLQIQQISDGTVKSIPKQIQGNEISRRDEVDKIISKLESENRIIILGDKGVGKSVLLCQLYQKLRETNPDVLFIRCDDFLGIDSIDELEKFLDGNKHFSSIIRDWPVDSKLIILFDSLDAISRNTKSVGIFKQFLKKLWGTNKIKTVCSVRSYDYECSYLISTTEWGYKILLNELPEDSFESMLEKLGNPNIPDSLKHILKNPLRLKLLSMILTKNPNIDLSKITNEVQLYNKHWKEYVEKQSRPIQITKTLFDISKKMILSQKIVLPYTALNDSENISEICSLNIIKALNGQIQFFHHAYLDYVVSKYIIQNYSDVSEFLKKDEYNVFLRPTLVFTLSLLYNSDKIKYVENILKICKSELKYYWKMSALKSLAEISYLDSKELDSISELLTENLFFQRYFLIEASKIKNPFWFCMWSKSVLVQWYSKESGNGAFLVDYLESLGDFTQHHKQILELIKSIVKKNEHPMIKYKAIKVTTKISVSEKSDWYEQLSKNKEPRIRSGILTCLHDLLDTNPKRVSEIFKNIFTYTEISQERTQLAFYGTFSLTSNKMQDNQHVIWEAGKIFPKLLEKNPIEMTKAGILIFEEIKKDHFTDDATEMYIVEDRNNVWYHEHVPSDIHNENKLIRSIQNHIAKLSEEHISEFIPLLKSTKLSIFHKILLEVLIKNPEKFKNEIYEEISQPIILKIRSLRSSTRHAIKKTSPLLSELQIKKLLQNITELTILQRQGFNEDEGLRLTNEAKAMFLKEFDEGLLSKEHLKILEQFSETELKNRSPSQFSDTSLVKVPQKKLPEFTLEEIMEKLVRKKLDPNQIIRLLNSMVDYLGKKKDELDDSKLEKIQEYLLSLQDHDDPEYDYYVQNNSSLMIVHETVRGLVARGVIRLFYHTRNILLKKIILKLSKDKINTVRNNVAQELPYLFFVDSTLALEIATRYSKESDDIVHFFLDEIIQYLLEDYADDALSIIHNLFEKSDTNDYQYAQNWMGSILYLALQKNNLSAKKFLQKIIETQGYATRSKQDIPFILKEQYLFNSSTQNEALDIFLKLLNVDDSKVKEKSVFFLLCSIEKNRPEHRELLPDKIINHLDKIADEIKSHNPEITEHLVIFLEDFWELIPSKTLDYLERISNVQDFQYQVIITKGTITILNGMFQSPSLKKEDKNRILSILDKFVMAGWCEALELLSMMERPD